MATRLKIMQAGEQVLRQKAQALTADEIRSREVQQLIEMMRETMRDAPGVGLAAPQIGLSLQLAVIEDPVNPRADLSSEALAERERTHVPFHVIINPEIYLEPDERVEFFEGCLSVTGFAALVPRARVVKVECLNEKAEAITINARGWYARILQHEIDHLNGVLYLDRMHSRSFMTAENLQKYWATQKIPAVREALSIGNR
ncbi:MAG TPA: peptide deformylase [Blastocatellia bacterium]|nr:peptide deformylase [Blastocatellia bacterium]